MFQWLSRLVWHEDFIGEIIPGLTRREEQYHEEKRRRQEKEVQEHLEWERKERERKLTDPYYARRESERKRELLELKLKDAEWILEHEKRLATLQKKTERQRSLAKQHGANTERLGKLEHHLAGRRRDLSLD